MKKILFLVSIIITSFTTTQAQTEEETLIWLQNYANELGTYPILLFDDDGYESISISKSNGFLLHYSDARKVKYITHIDIESLKYLYIKPDELEKKYAGTDNKLYYSYTLEFSKAVVYYSDCENFENCDKKEESLTFTFKLPDAQRVINAINHLAKLKGAKPKPQVKKSTF